jgi:hypothetical protein
MIRVSSQSLKLIIALTAFKLLLLFVYTVYTWTLTFPNEKPNESLNILVSLLSLLLLIIIIYYFKIFLNQILNNYSVNNIINGIIIITLIGEVFYSIDWNISEYYFVNRFPSIFIAFAHMILTIIYIIKILQIKNEPYFLELKIIGFSHLIFLLGTLVTLIPFSASIKIFEILSFLPYVGYLIIFNKAFNVFKTEEAKN